MRYFIELALILNYQRHVFKFLDIAFRAYACLASRWLTVLRERYLKLLFSQINS